jgi:hypothetical protein
MLTACALTAPAATALGATPASVRVIALNGRGVTGFIQDVPPRSSTGALSVGDRLTGVERLSGGARGTETSDCVVTGAARAIPQAQVQCALVYRLPRGELIAVGDLRLRPGQRVPIVGGTGAYAGARGYVTSRAPHRGFDSRDVLVLTG